MVSERIKYNKIEPERFYKGKPTYLKAIKCICIGVHLFTILVYTSSIICFCLGEMVHSQPMITLKTGHKVLDCLCVRFNPLMTEERVFISIVMFIGIILTSYDILCIWIDDLHLVSSGRFPEQMIFMFLVKMFAAMFLFTPRFMQVYWIRTGFWITMFVVPRFTFTALVGKLVKEQVTKDT